MLPSLFGHKNVCVQALTSIVPTQQPFRTTGHHSDCLGEGYDRLLAEGEASASVAFDTLSAKPIMHFPKRSPSVQLRRIQHRTRSLYKV